MDKETVAEGMQLLENHRKAESAYQKTYEAYKKWYYENMPRNAIRKSNIQQFVAENCFPIVSVACFTIGFFLGWYWSTH